MRPESPRHLTPADVAARLSLAKVDSVYALIKCGALAASNVSARTGRPCWRIAPEALDQFLADRRAVPAPKSERRTRRRRVANVVEYF